MSEFEVGDIVTLKSGGPIMTVKVVGDHYGTPTIWTIWFDGTKMHDGSFPPATLEKSEKRSSKVTVALD